MNLVNVFSERGRSGVTAIEDVSIIEGAVIWLIGGWFDRSRVVNQRVTLRREPRMGHYVQYRTIKTRLPRVSASGSSAAVLHGGSGAEGFFLVVFLKKVGHIH